MAGTVKGGRAAAVTNKTKHGADFYARIGAMGGKKGRTGGFAANPELARIAGAKGGRISRRTKKTDDATAKPAAAPQVQDDSAAVVNED
jgi:general stress protein YciG